MYFTRGKTGTVGMLCPLAAQIVVSNLGLEHFRASGAAVAILLPMLGASSDSTSPSVDEDLVGIGVDVVVEGILDSVGHFIIGLLL